MSTAPTPASQSALWARLLAFELDGPARLSFTQRLARDNDWAPAFARRVVLEYKKFLYLAATCGHPVTPSDEVDQAWHLHLVYTRSYWNELCGEVLGFPLHHGPTKGGPTEGHKFQDWYAQTRQSYQAAFGADPPADIWPPAAVRFGDAPHFRRVNRRRYFLIRRPRRQFSLNLRRWLPLAVGLVLVGCTARMPLNPFDWYGTEFLQLFWLLALTLLPLSVLLQHWGQGPAREPAFSGELSTYELARLAGKGQRVADSAMAAMACAGQLELVVPRSLRQTDEPPPTDPYELAIWRTLLPALYATDTAQVREGALNPTLPALQEIDDSLEAKGLLLPATTRQRIDLLPIITLVALLLFGLIKLLVGLSRGRPVGYLIFSLLGLGLATFQLGHFRAWQSGAGAQVLKQWEEKLARERRERPVKVHTVALTVAFFGLSVLQDFSMNDLYAYLAPPPSSSDGGSGGGDGGSGCGGGGCGGCGS